MNRSRRFRAAAWILTRSSFGPGVGSGHELELERVVDLSSSGLLLTYQQGVRHCVWFNSIPRQSGQLGELSGRDYGIQGMEQLPRCLYCAPHRTYIYAEP